MDKGCVWGIGVRLMYWASQLVDWKEGWMDGLMGGDGLSESEWIDETVGGWVRERLCEGARGVRRTQYTQLDKQAEPSLKTC